MAKVLSLFRRWGVAEGEPSPRPAAPIPPPVSQSAKASEGDDDAGSGEGNCGGATTTVTVAADASATPSADIVVARRQSQINLNKFLAATPYGLNAVLKQPSRGDMLEALRSLGSGSLGAALPATSQQQQQGGGPGDMPPMKRARERRRSMTATELAQSMQNIDVSQAAMIMMPSRLRQELGGLQQSFSQPLPAVTSAPMQVRPSGPLPSVISADSYSLSAVFGTTGGGGVLAGGPPTPRLERKPSLIREAVKLQQHPLQSRSLACAGDSPLWNTAGGSAGDSPPQPPAAPAAPATAALPQPGAGGGIAIRRSVAPPGLSPLQLQQLQQGAGGSLLTGSSRTGITFNSASPPSPGALGLGVPGPVRRSEMGEGGLGRGRGLEGPGTVSPVFPSNGGLPLSPTVNVNGAHTAHSGTNSKDLRRGGLPVRGSESFDDEGPLAGLTGSSSQDVRFPVISGAGTPLRRVGVVEAKDKDKEGTSSMNGGGARAGLTAADVAALSEAMSAYESEAVRLRAMAVRKVDSRIKKAVMDRRQIADVETEGGSPSLLDGTVAGSLITPLIRQQGMGLGANKARAGIPSSASRGGPRGGSMLTAVPGVATTGHTTGDPLMRARTRLLETEAETAEELNQLRRGSHLGPRVVVAADLASDPAAPKRIR